MTDKLRIAVLGAGFAGLETAFLLRMRMRDHADLTLVSEREAFSFRPNTIYVPFGADPDDLVVDLEKAFHRRRVAFVQGRVAGVDPDAHTVRLSGDRRRHAPRGDPRARRPRRHDLDAAEHARRPRALRARA
jgi:NADH dehydrogenase FAD-containing subunit